MVQQLGGKRDSGDSVLDRELLAQLGHLRTVDHEAYHAVIILLSRMVENNSSRS